MMMRYEHEYVEHEREEDQKSMSVITNIKHEIRCADLRMYFNKH